MPLLTLNILYSTQSVAFDDGMILHLDMNLDPVNVATLAMLQRAHVLREEKSTNAIYW